MHQQLRLFRGRIPVITFALAFSVFGISTRKVQAQSTTCCTVIDEHATHEAQEELDRQEKARLKAEREAYKEREKQAKEVAKAYHEAAEDQYKAAKKAAKEFEKQQKAYARALYEAAEECNAYTEEPIRLKAEPVYISVPCCPAPEPVREKPACVVPEPPKPICPLPEPVREKPAPVCPNPCNGYR
jgi:hypothetical protein